MGENQVEGLMGTTMDRIRGMVDANTIIGDPIKIGEDSVVIPVSKVSYGFAAGGSDFVSKKTDAKDLFGGGSGAGITISPIAFLAVNKGEVKLMQIESFDSALDRIICMTPDLIEKITTAIKNNFNKKKADKKDINE